MDEIWKDIYFVDNGIEYDYRGLYQVSNFGRIKSLNYRHTGKEGILKGKKNSWGYLQVILWKDGSRKSYYVHRLVAQAFLPNPDNLPIINHKDEDLSIQEKIYAELEFLGYCTLQDNNFKSTIGAITDISDKFSTRWISIYFLKTGETQKFKIKYSMIQESELKVGDIVNVKEVKERAKSILVDGQWSADMSQMEQHITNIKKVGI